MSELEGREAAQVRCVKPSFVFFNFHSFHSRAEWLTCLQSKKKRKKKAPRLFARVLIFSVFVKAARRLAAVTVSCRPHKWRPVRWVSASKNWLGSGSEQEVWSRASTNVRLRAHRRGHCLCHIWHRYKHALAAASKPFPPPPETPATPPPPHPLLLVLLVLLKATSWLTIEFQQ